MSRTRHKFASAGLRSIQIDLSAFLPDTYKRLVVFESVEFVRFNSIRHELMFKDERQGNTEVREDISEKSLVIGDMVVLVPVTPKADRPFQHHS